MYLPSELYIKIMGLKKLGLLVITKNKIIKGILTDGDARRGIKNIYKNEKINKFMSPNPYFISENDLASKALSIMNEKKITSLLVVSDKDNKKKSSKKLKGIVHIHSLLQYGIK